MDWLDLLAVQGTLKSLLQHHSSQALTIGPLNNWDVTKLRVTPPPATPSTQLLHIACSKGERAPWGSLVCNLLFPVYVFPWIPLVLLSGLDSHKQALSKLKGVCSLIILLSVLGLILFIFLATSGVYVLFCVAFSFASGKATSTHCQTKYLICQQHPCELIIIQWAY